MTRSRIIKIFATAAWAVAAASLAMLIAEGDLGPFLGMFAFLNLPAALYWLGFLLWGDGYLRRLNFTPDKPLESRLLHRNIGYTAAAAVVLAALATLPLSQGFPVTLTLAQALGAFLLTVSVAFFFAAAFFGYPEYKKAARKR